MSIKCGNCKSYHDSIDQVKVCHQGKVLAGATLAVNASTPPEFQPTTTTAVPVQSLDKVPAGHYVAIIDGVDRFYRVQYGKKGGKWEGFCFVDAQASDEYHPIKNKAHKASVLDAIRSQGVLECLKRYGHALGKCGICNKTLTDPESIAKGIGPICEAGL